MCKTNEEWAVAFAHLVHLLRGRLTQEDLDDLVQKAKSRAKRMMGRRRGP